MPNARPILTKTTILGIAVFTSLTLLSFSLLGPGEIAGGDEAEYLAVTHSIVKDKDIYLENQGRIFEPHYPPHWGKPNYLLVRNDNTAKPTFFPPNYVVNVIPYRNHLLPYHPLGLSLLVAPGEILWGTWGARLVIITCATLLAINIYKELGSVLITLGAMLSPPLIYFSLLVFNEIPAALLLFYAYRKIKTGATNKLDTILLNAAVFLLPWLHLKYVLTLPILLVYLFERTYHCNSAVKNRLSGAIATLNKMKVTIITSIATVLLLFALYQTAYGTWKALLATAHPGLISPMVGGLGLLVDRDYGLIINAPLYLLTIFSFCRLKASKSEWLPITIILLFLFGNSLFANWHGGAAPAGRFLVPILPFLLLLLRQLESSLQRTSKIIFIGAIVTFILFGEFLAYLNLFKLRNLGFTTPNRINETWAVIPSGKQVQQLFPSLLQ